MIFEIIEDLEAKLEPLLLKKLLLTLNWDWFRYLSISLRHSLYIFSWVDDCRSKLMENFLFLNMSLPRPAFCSVSATTYVPLGLYTYFFVFSPILNSLSALFGLFPISYSVESLYIWTLFCEYTECFFKWPKLPLSKNNF